MAYDFDIEQMDYQTAVNQAREYMQPEYENQLEETMGDLQTEQLSRGFYGQAPGDYIQSSVATDMSSEYQANLAREAQNIINQDFGRQMAESQFEFSQYQYENEEEQEQGQNALDSIIAGASIGASFGPWGAAIGGLAGLASSFLF